MPAEASSQQTELYWLALHLVPGLGARNALKLIRTFGDPQQAFHASLTELQSLGLREAVAQAIHAGISFEDAANEQRKAEAAGAEIIPFQDPRYPQRLKEIYDPPVVLYARGDTELLEAPSVAVVGSRRPTPYGAGAAQKLSRELSNLGVAVISGMARGVDTAAHRGALEGRTGTIAVLGCGADVVYPKENGKLAEQIIERGVIVSEFPLGTTAFPQNFPIRNRVISGLSLGVMVVEGAQYSGSLITARLALDQGREVFAVPGNIVSKLSWGPNLLIKQGATLVQEANDVIEQLPLPVRRELRLAEQEAARAEPARPAQSSIWDKAVSPLGKQLLALLREDASLHIDEIVRDLAERSPAEILSALSELELYGAIKQLPGKHFVRAWPV